LIQIKGCRWSVGSLKLQISRSCFWPPAMVYTWTHSIPVSPVDNTLSRSGALSIRARAVDRAFPYVIKPTSAEPAQKRVKTGCRRCAKYQGGVLRTFKRNPRNFQSASAGRPVTPVSR
jgi:hypothetical protein